MKPNVSLIIPSYNKAYELDLLLYSIERQTFDHSHFEVIVVDDGSTDRTIQNLTNYRPPFQFHYIRNVERMGRAFTRNRGIKVASGDILIFLDSEMIIDTDFVTNHVKHHLVHTNRVVTGAMHLKGIYTVYYPDFSRGSHHRLRALLKQDRSLYTRFKPYIKKAIAKNRAIPLITKKDIAIGLHKKLSFQRPYFPEVIQKFGCNLLNYKLPWTAFLSGNVSLRKELITRAGGFDEGFKGWGFEDWEMGFRLHQIGGEFLAEPHAYSYHQEHPVFYPSVNKEMYTNYRYYQSKHPYFETSLHSTFFLGLINRIDEHVMVEQYQLLEREYPGEYVNFTQALMHIFRSTARLLDEGSSREEILALIKSDELVQNNSFAWNERYKLEQMGICPTLIWLFDTLVHH